MTNNNFSEIANINREFIQEAINLQKELSASAKVIYDMCINENLFMKEVESIKKFESFNKAMKKISKELSDISQSLIQFTEIDSIMNSVNDFSKVFMQISVPNELIKIKLPVKWLDFVVFASKANWPIFLYYSDELFNSIQKVQNGKVIDVTDERISNTIIRYFDNELCNQILEYWLNSEVIDKKRKPLLREAVEQHKSKNYYSSTALLMCELYGICNDINKFCKRNEFTVTSQDKEFIAKFFSINIDKIDHEKGKLFQIIAISEKGVLLTEVIAKYLKKTILSSSESKNLLHKQPIRNKICHGEQLNYNTEEHSLKAILVIDILVHLSSDIATIIKYKKHVNLNSSTK